ncbi:MAG: DNA topoisomerase, partial [Clostridia bacterium]|nr:DNA topoisomerase [Clostridia bacterium]
MQLIIVESPHKAKTIEKFLKGDYKVDASKGHIRDLPVNRMGIKIDKNFEPFYEISPDKKADIKRLKDDANKADKIFLATDPDREGEAISWHLSEVLELNKNEVNRIEFNEISEKAVKNALDNPRKIDMNLVDAQQARRVLDRLVGYSISPAASSRLNENLSAGRVQSVALKMVVDREREITAFVPQEYWNLKAEVKPEGKNSFKVLLVEKSGKKYKPSNEEEAIKVENELKGLPFKVNDIKKTVVKSHAPAPFITSTLQQDGS